MMFLFFSVVCVAVILAFAVKDQYSQYLSLLDKMQVVVMGKGCYSWMWSIIHPQTKFVIARDFQTARDQIRQKGICSR
jgi:hypothetical protein